MTITDDEHETVESVLKEQDATEIERWRRVDPESGIVPTTSEIIVQWNDEDDQIGVVVTKFESDDSVSYSARARKLTDDVQFANISITSTEESLETAVDRAIQWMRRNLPGVPLPAFSMRIEGGILKPLVDILRRLGGGNVLIEVRDDAIVIESASHINAVDFRIPASDMESFEVEQKGEAVTDIDPIWDALRSVNYSDVVPVAMGESDDRVRLQVAAQSTAVRVGASYTRRSIPDVDPWDARFTVPGIEYRDKMRALSVIDAEDTVLGVRDGVAFFVAESNDEPAEVTGRLDTTEAQGDMVQIVATDRLQQLRRAVPRPSKTPVTFTLKADTPMLAEYTVSDTDVDVRIAMKTGAVPREVELPPEEVQVPEGESVPSGEPPSEGEFADLEASLEEVAPGAEWEIEEEAAGFTVTMRPDPDGVQWVKEREVSRTAESLDFAIGQLLETWELNVDHRTIDYDAIQSRRRSLSREVDVTIPRFPMLDEETTDSITISAPVEGKGEKHIVFIVSGYTPADELDAAREEVRERLGDGVLQALFDATPRGSGNNIGEARWVRDELESVELDRERIEELVEGVDGVTVPWREEDADDDGIDAALEEAVDEMEESHEDEPPEAGDGDTTERTLFADEWELLIEALRWTAAQASEQDNATAAITVKEIADDLDAQASVVREMEPEEWATVVESLRFVAFEAEHGGDPMDAADDLGDIADKLEEQTEVEDVDPLVTHEIEEVEEDDEPPTGLDEGVIELRITVEEAIGGRHVYAPPPQSVSIGVSEEIADATEEKIGAATENRRNVRVGTAFVTDDDVASNRELLRVEVQDTYLPDDEEADEEREVPPEEEMEPESGDTSITVTLLGGTLNYVTRGSNPSEVEDEAITAARETLGPPGQFEAGDTVGHIEYTGTTIDTFDFEPGRELLAEYRDEEEEEVAEEGDVEVEVEEGDTPDDFGITVEGTFGEEVIEGAELEQMIEDEDDLSKSEIETIVEGATIAVDAQARIIQGRLSDIILSLDHATPVSYKQEVGSVKTRMGDTRVESTLNAIDRWEAVTRTGSLTDGQVAQINEARVALNEQFGLDIPLLEPSNIEGFSEADVREIVEDSTSGVSVDVRSNPDADSLRITMEPDIGGDVAFTGSLSEVQGAASNPGGAIRDALTEWNEAADLATVDVDAVNRGRTRVEKRFDVNLPRVEEPSDGDVDTADTSELVDVWESLTVDMETVEVDEDVLIEQEGLALPVEVDQEMAEFADEEGKTQIEQGLLIHFDEDVRDEIHAILARALDTEPENYYDSSKPSELEEYDLFRRFSLTRNSAPGPWTNPRFAPSTLFKLLQPVDGDRIKIVSRGAPLS